MATEARTSIFKSKRFKLGVLVLAGMAGLLWMGQIDVQEAVGSGLVALYFMFSASGGIKLEKMLAEITEKQTTAFSNPQKKKR